MSQRTMRTGYRLLTAIRRITRSIDLHSKRLEKLHGLTVPQLLLLTELDDSPPATASDLSKTVSLSLATVTNILDRLEEHGYVSRSRSTVDRRVVIVRPTEKAAKVLKQHPPVLPEHFASRFRTLPDYEQELILSSFLRISSLMDGANGAAASED